MIIPTYNRAHVVGRAIRSVQCQSVEDWECLVVDDASTDDTEATVRALDDSRIRYLRHDINRGGSAARNTAIAAARGAFLAFLDADDEWRPEKLAKQIAAFSAAPGAELGAVLCGILELEPDGRTAFQRLPDPGEMFQSALSLDYPGGKIQIMVRRSLADDGLRFDESLVSHQDRDFFLEVARRARIGVVPDALYVHYRQFPNRVYDTRNAIAGHIQLTRKWASDIQRVPGLAARYDRRLAMLYYRAHDMANARRALFSAWRRNPSAVDTLLQLIAALAGRKGMSAYLRATASIRDRS